MLEDQEAQEPEVEDLVEEDQEEGERFSRDIQKRHGRHFGEPWGQGWKQFLAAKAEMLAAYDRAREYARAHEIETYHGVVAEATFRKWLSEFLPQKYGVTSGYIVSQFADEDSKLPHFDVIIYDRLEAPVLWVESHADASPDGRARAIPVEYVRGVIEVKSSFERVTVRQALQHLDDLKPLLAGVDNPTERWRKYLPVNFVSATVFFESRRQFERTDDAFGEVLPSEGARGYLGCLVLRPKGSPPEHAGYYCYVGRSSSAQAGRTQVGAVADFSQFAFQKFAFALVAILNDAYQYDLAYLPSSYYVMPSPPILPEQ
jgi:hypothetical protein